MATETRRVKACTIGHDINGHVCTTNIWFEVCMEASGMATETRRLWR
jgi:hypothetical protein